ncbi:MAG: sigma-70 family RNA polymerase sigma factor [Patescibacteria group bacterium]|jgi:RNA polymerase sigma-70 factor (ECF subfamily)
MTSEEEIQEIVASAQSGDEASVARLFELFSERVFRYLRARVADRHTAEDLTQTVFLEMIQALKRYKQQKAKFSTWLFQIARFRLIDHYRKAPPPLPFDESLFEHPSLIVDAQVDVVWPSRMDAALAKLPERYQTVLHLRFREELTHEEVARSMRLTTLHVRVLQSRALKALRKHLPADVHI